MASYLKRLEAMCYSQVDRILFDTRSHIEYVTQEFSLPREKLRHVYISADEGIFRPTYDRYPSNTCNVIWYGSFLPLHGVEIIMDAIRLLCAEENLSFTVVGGGPKVKEFARWLRQLDNPRIFYSPWLSRQRLGEFVRRADIFLGGHFSSIPKASRVIPSKVFEGAAAGKAMILGDNPANREIFSPNGDAAFVEMANSGALADSILDLASDPLLRERYGRRAREAYVRLASSKILARELDIIIGDVLN
jgi:glycosyltransferase involved in cell wall biosynthesis